MTRLPTLVVGAGIGGLACAVRLAGAGERVTVIERATGPGGKLRAVPTEAGPADTGPTVMTLKPLFDALFESVGERLEDHVDLDSEPLLARHWWPDGSGLDLFHDRRASREAVHAFAGARAASEFDRFSAEAERIFQAFLRPVMEAPKPDLPGIMAATLRNPGMLGALLPGQTLWKALSARFSDPRLVQLFARYATYVGGSPFASPALLMLICHAEAAGVWRIRGGMSTLATAMQTLAERMGTEFQYGNGVAQIERRSDGFRVTLDDGNQLSAARIVFNGDPGALARGLLGPQMQGAVRKAGVAPRALSAWVWAFAAEPSGVPLAHHNVFFNDDYAREFDAVAAGEMPSDCALYVCAQDRGTGLAPTGSERFEIIMNGSAIAAGTHPGNEDTETCRTRTFETLSRMGLTFSKTPGRDALSTPHDFASRFPGSDGSLYGRSPHGTMASFLRPTALSRIPGLYLAGGGVHPGAGLPMALTSGRHAAEAILKDRASTSTSRRTGMRGGISTGSRTMASAASRSSPS